MTLTKKVNGITVVLSEEEEAETRLQWKKNKADLDAQQVETGHLKKRRRKYPSTEEQLEAIYTAIMHLKIEGTNFPLLVETWLSKIEKINNSYPPK